MKIKNLAFKHLAQFLAANTRPLVRCCFGLMAVVLTLAAPLRAAPSPAPRSRLLIPAGQQFELGGGQPQGFRFVGKNVSAVGVEVRELLADGRVVARGTVAPGQAVELLFGAGSRALLLNNSTRRAKFRIDASLLNPRELRMTYSQLGQ